MKSRLTQSIHIELKPSVLLLGLLGAIAILSCVIVWQLPVQLSIKLGLFALVVFSTVYFSLRDALLMLSQSWRSLEVNHQGVLKLINRQGRQIEPILANDTFIHPYMTILNIERSGLEFDFPPVILLTSQENQQQLRQLRVWLRWWKHQEDLSGTEGLLI